MAAKHESQVNRATKMIGFYPLKGKPPKPVRFPKKTVVWASSTKCHPPPKKIHFLSWVFFLISTFSPNTVVVFFVKTPKQPDSPTFFFFRPPKNQPDSTILFIELLPRWMLYTRLIRGLRVFYLFESLHRFAMALSEMFVTLTWIFGVLE